MNLINIFALFTLSVMVKSAWWAAAVQPVILSLGAIFSAIDQDVLDIQWLPFINKQEETKTLEDASGDLMMLEDDDEKVPYQIGEVFVYLTQDEAQEKIETSKDNLGEAIKVVETRAQAIKDEMSGLKAQLYAKFGSAINLEADEE